MNRNKKIILSFDVEEFDLPLEFGQKIGTEEQLYVGYEGLRTLLPLLQTASMKTTLFTTAFFAASYPQLIKELAAQHEIASHTYYHSSFETEDLRLSKKRLEEITGKEVSGLRMPRMKAVPNSDVRQAGFQYNSSINPTWIPGRYNQWRRSRVPYKEEGIVQVPVSVTPYFRFPLFWLAFKNLPYNIYLRLARQTLRTDGHLLLYFHPWEFTDLSPYGLPAYLERDSRTILLSKLHRLVKDLSNEGSFCTLQDFLNDSNTDDQTTRTSNTLLNIQP